MVVPNQTDITAINIKTSLFNNSTNSYSNHTNTYGGLKNSAGSQFPYTLTFTDNGTSNLIINYIKTGTNGFSIADNNPGLPYVLTPGSSIGITTYINSPKANYTGVLTLSVSETSYPKKAAVPNQTEITAVSFQTSLFK